MANLDSNGLQMEVGDIIEVTVMYKVTALKTDGVHAAKVIGAPPERLVKIPGSDYKNHDIVPEDFHFIP